ncbi:MAG: S-layer homology domain-containing protein [Clostridia bacterium]|nr:S-layer homology domain-containing protein [Clostridia bacterium]
MKRIWIRRVLPMVACCLLLALATVPMVYAGASGQPPVVSYGLQVLSAKTDMAMSAPVGNDIVFSEDAFARALNLSKVTSITIRSLPAVTEGELLLGSTRIAQGQTVSAANLPYMSFEPASADVAVASFTFVANEGSIPMVCRMYQLSSPNYTPTVSMASGLSLNVSTYKDLRAYGTLSAYDPDGDTPVFEIVSYPKNGSVRLEDATLGTYVYTPEKGFVGSDAFSYVARDRYGNYSASATVKLKVAPSGTSVTYADMQDSTAYNAALALTESGIMSGKQVGNTYYFYPNEGVRRVEFLVMAMHAAGITEVPKAQQTVFADDADIPENMKGYVAAAYTLGYVNGTNVEGELCFLPNEEITRAQAAVILGNIVGISDVAVTPTFADASEIPVWAKDAIYSLNAVGIMTAMDGNISPTAKLTREQTALLLAAVMAYDGN